MLNSTNLLEILHDHFKNDLTLKRKCLDGAKNKINRKLANRVFDEFPLLINQTNFQSLTDEFSQVLKKPTRKSVHNFEIHIINIACDQLLDQNGKIKSELIKFFEWNSLASPIDNYNVVSAFVGAVTASIVRESASVIQEDNNTFSSTATHINKNYGKWILDVMRERDFDYNPAYEADLVNLSDIIQNPFTKPAFAASLLFGGVFGAAIYGGYELYKKFCEDNAPLESPSSLQKK
jgi:hypothetical protein